jgi:hypothetical protein
VIEVAVEPHIAFSTLLKNARLEYGLSQVETVERPGIEGLFSCQWLEKKGATDFQKFVCIL